MLNSKHEHGRMSQKKKCYIEFIWYKTRWKENVVYLKIKSAWD